MLMIPMRMMMKSYHRMIRSKRKRKKPKNNLQKQRKQLRMMSLQMKITSEDGSKERNNLKMKIKRFDVVVLC